jgi:NAD(P)-dependent dehydrogenase (short-subunit alcohol dehydrogenase family)
MGRLDGRVAVITGSGRGIGRSLALRFAQEGASIVVCDIGAALDGSADDTSVAQQVVNEIEAAGGKAIAQTKDITSFSNAEEIIRTSVETFGSVDIVVNVAGIVRDRMLFNMAEEEWDAVVKVHMKGTFNMSRHAASYWREQKNENGNYRLINITSRAGLHGAPGQPNYDAAKMGIVGFTYAAANSLNRYGATANCLSPTADTRMTETSNSPMKGQFGSPDEVAPIAAWLASPASAWCNGQIIAIRGKVASLYSNPRQLAQIVSQGEWDIDGFGNAAEKHFKDMAQAQTGWPTVVPEVPVFEIPGLDVASGAR